MEGNRLLHSEPESPFPPFVFREFFYTKKSDDLDRIFVSTHQCSFVCMIQSSSTDLPLIGAHSRRSVLYHIDVARRHLALLSAYSDVESSDLGLSHRP